MQNKKAVAEQPTDILAGLVDELGDLSEVLSAAAKAEKRAEAIKKQLKEAHASLPPGEGATITGKRWIADMTPQEFRDVVNMDGALKAIGSDKFWPLFTQPPTAKIIEQLPSDLHSTLVSRKQVGPRKITTRPAPITKTKRKAA